MIRRPNVFVNRYRLDNDALIERVRLSPPLVMNLAKHNSMNAAQVSAALDAGKKVYTSFSYYQKEGINANT